MARIAFWVRAASVALLVFLLAPGALLAGPGQTLTVKDLQVVFLPDAKVHVKGKLRLTGMVPSKVNEPWSEIAVHVDFPRGDDGFALLPDCFEGMGTSENYRLGTAPSWKHRGKWYAKAKTKKVFYRSTWILGPAVLERQLENDKHEGQWIAFDKTLDYAAMPVKDRAEYRVVFEWTIHGTQGRDHRTQVFWHYYLWAVYGPFPWGTAPACDRPLVGTYCRPASFTERGVEVAEPAAIDKDKGPGEEKEDEPPKEEAKPEKRPKLKRPDKRPTHLEAVDACDALKAKLLAMSEVEGVGAGMPPGLALIQISYVAGMEAEALTKLVADVAMETAYAAPWIDTLKLSLDGDRGGTSVTITWDALEKYSAGETTPAEFFATWEVGGKPLVAPAGN